MNRKHKNKKKEYKTFCSSDQKPSTERKSSGGQSIEEVDAEELKKDVVNVQETNVDDEPETEVWKALKRQHNSKKQECPDYVPVLEKEIQNQKSKIDAEEKSLSTVNNINETSTTISTENETKLEQNVQPVLSKAQKKKNKKHTRVPDVTEETTKNLVSFQDIDQVIIGDAEKNDDLGLITVSHNPLNEQESNRKKKKDKKNKKMIDFEESDKLSEKKSTSDLKNEIRLKSTLMNVPMLDDIVQKSISDCTIAPSKTDDKKLEPKQNSQNESIEVEKIKEEAYSNSVSIDETEWKMGKQKKKNKKDKKMNINVKDVSRSPIVFHESQPTSVKISTSDLERPFEELDSQIETNEFSIMSKQEEIVLSEVKNFNLSEAYNVECLSPRNEEFCTNNNTMSQKVGQNVQTVALKVPFLIPDTPFVQTNDQLTLTTTFPNINSANLKLAEKADFEGEIIEMDDGLEELKVSIEKSMAELTALEKEENIKEFESMDNTPFSSKIINNETKSYKEITEVIEPAKGSQNVGSLILQVEEKNLIYPVVDTTNYVKQKQEKEKTKFIQSDTAKADNIDNNEEHILFDVTKENSTYFDEDDENVQERHEKVEKGTHLRKKVKENYKSPLQETHEKLYQESKEKSKKKNKQKAGGNQNTKMFDGLKSKSSDVNISCENVCQSLEADCYQKAPSSDPSKVEHKKIEELTEKSCEYDVVSKDRTNSNIEEEFIEFSLDNIKEFEESLPTVLDDINKSFEVIDRDSIDVQQLKEKELILNECHTAIQECSNEIEKEKEYRKSENKSKKGNTILSHSKNLLGFPSTHVSSNKTDFKEEKNKKNNGNQPKVKIQDSVKIEKGKKQSKESRTGNKKEPTSSNETEIEPFCVANTEEDYVYKYSFRKVFLLDNCQVCKEDLTESRVPCSFCSLVFYCSPKHKDEDWNNHQALCFAASSIANTKGLKFIYSDAKDLGGQNYRLLRMQAIVSCEKILQRKLAPWEQEALLYPRMCVEAACREWIQNSLKDCEACGQIAYCKENPDHLSKSHQRWCKSYHLYKKLVIHQQTIGKLEPKLPTRVVRGVDFRLPDKINELLATLYEEKIDMDDVHYAALTQVTTTPLTTAYCYQLYDNHMNSTMANGVHKKSTFIVHSIGAELQFEADALNKWEIFFLHLRPDITELNVVLIGPNLNPSNLPLGVLSKIKLCQYCRENKRRVRFSFHDKKHYYEFYDSDDFNIPDIVCAFNPNIHRAFMCDENNSWISTLKRIFKTRAPFCLTSYTPNELDRDLASIGKCAQSEFRVVVGPSLNPYSSVRPDRNFISDEEMPLIFKNYYYVILCGTS